jgi:hypothetical protein
MTEVLEILARIPREAGAPRPRWQLAVGVLALVALGGGLFWSLRAPPLPAASIGPDAGPLVTVSEPVALPDVLLPPVETDAGTGAKALTVVDSAPFPVRRDAGTQSPRVKKKSLKPFPE